MVKNDILLLQVAKVAKNGINNGSNSTINDRSE